MSRRQDASPPNPTHACTTFSVSTTPPLSHYSFAIQTMIHAVVLPALCHDLRHNIATIAPGTATFTSLVKLGDGTPMKTRCSSVQSQRFANSTAKTCGLRWQNWF